MTSLLHTVALSLLGLALTTGSLRGGGVIERVWPDKIVYGPNEPARLQVTLVNNGTIEANVVAQFDLLSGLDRQEELGRQTIVIPAGSTNQLAFAWNTGTRAWGHAAQVSLRGMDGAVLDQKAEYFNIADNVWKVGIDAASFGHIQIDIKTFKVDRDDIARRMHKARRTCYGNYYEMYAWAPDDFFELAPQTSADDELWRSATGGYLVSKNYVRAIIDACHQEGIRAVTYLQPYGIGRRTMAMLRKHPAWFAYSENGQPLAGFTYKQTEDYRTQHVATYRGLSRCMAELNLANSHVVDAGIDQIVATTKMFGWDGCRFDNTCYQAGGGRDFAGKIAAETPAERNRLTLWALNRLRERLTRELGPQYLVGHNFSYYARQINPVAWDKIAGDGWMVEDEMMNRAFSLRGQNTRPWLELVDWMQTARDATWKQGGHYYTIGFSGEEHTIPTRTHQLIFTVASGCHPQQYHYGYWLLNHGAYMAFITRFSAFLWDNRALAPVADPKPIITVKADRNILWERFVYERKVDDGAQTIVHLINSPLHPINGNPAAKYPPPIPNITVACALPAGKAPRKAFVLTAEPTVAIQELPVEVRDNRASVTVPRLDLWSIVVFDWSQP